MTPKWILLSSILFLLTQKSSKGFPNGFNLLEVVPNYFHNIPNDYQRVLHDLQWVPNESGMALSNYQMVPNYF